MKGSKVSYEQIFQNNIFVDQNSLKIIHNAPKDCSTLHNKYGN
jgi:hypothetical protein